MDEACAAPVASLQFTMTAPRLVPRARTHFTVALTPSDDPRITVTTANTGLNQLPASAVRIKNCAMTEPMFTNRRLAQLYDPLDPDRSDLDAYAAIVTEFGARSVIDVGCGTGVFACMLAQHGIAVTGVDPARASLEVARAKPHANKVTWIHGYATDLPKRNADMATMTANVAQVFLTDADFVRTLRAIRSRLKAGGRLVFETRNPQRRPWLNWNRDATHTVTDIPEIGLVETWCDLNRVEDPFVTFTWTHIFDSDGAVCESESTLRFRSRQEIEHALAETGFTVDDVRDAADRPGREFVFVASRR